MRRLLIIAIAAIAAAVPAAAIAGPATPAVPGEIAVTGPHKPYLVAHAEGVQIYECSAVAGGHAWRLVAPRAKSSSTRVPSNRLRTWLSLPHSGGGEANAGGAGR